MAENTTYRSDIYSPEIERPDDSGGFSIKDTLFGMAKFAIGMAVLGKVGNITSKGIYKAIANKNTSLASSILKGAGKASPSELSMGSLLRGVVKTGMEPSSSVPHALSQASRAAMATGAFAKGVHTRLAGSQYIGSRAIAGMGKSFYKALPMGVSTYALERAGVINSTREEQPAWYNVPGHVKGMLTATADMAMYDMGIGGIKRFAGFAKSNIGKVVGRDASPGLHAFMDKHFAIRRDNSGKVQAGTFLRGVTQFAAIFDGARAATKEGSGVLREAYKSRWGNRTERSQQRSSLLDFSVKSLKNNIRNKAQEGWSRGYNTRKDTLKNYKADYGNDFVRSMQRVHELMDEKGGTQGVSKEVPFEDKTFQALHNLIKKTNDRASNSMGSTVLGRKNATVADLIQTRTVNKKEFYDVFDKFRSYDSNAVVRDEMTKLQQSVLTMSAGKNIFKTSGGIVDYSMYSPKNMLSSFAGFVSPYFTVKMPGFDKELPLSDIMSLHGKLGKEGLGIFSMRVGEQVYRDTEKNANRLVGDSFMKGSHNLGGMLIDGELFTTTTDGILTKADTTLKKMVVSTPYSREALLYKANAIAATDTAGAMSDLLGLQEKNSKRGIVDRLNDFGDRWGIGLPTSGHIRRLLNGVNQMFGFSPMKVGAKKSVDMILDPRSSVDALRGDATVLLGGLGELGNNAADQLYNVLSNDGIMQDMARLAGSRGHKQLASKISTMRKATKKSDDEIFKLVKKSVKSNDKLQDSVLSYASDHYIQFGSYGLDFQTKGNSFSTRNTPLTRRQAAIKDYMLDAFTELGQEASDVTGVGANMADWLLNDSKVLSKLSKNDTRHLKMLSTKIELHRTGILDGSGKVALKGDSLAVKKTFDMVRTKLKDERHYLESNFFNTRAVQDIGPLGFGNGQRDRSLVEEFYKGIETRQQGVINKSFHIMKDSDDLIGDVGSTINGLIDRVMDMGNNFGVRYGAQERKPVTLGFKTKDISLFGYNTSIKGREFGTIGGPMYTMAKRIAQGIGVMAAAQTLDTFASVNPLFTGTMLDNGIYEPIADTYVKANMAFHKVKDLTGITEAAKYLEGLMPSSTSTIPGAVIGGALKGPLGVLPGAVINRFLDANNILPEFDKTYDEMKDIYSGRELVPIKRGRFWLFSKGSFEGDGVKFHVPGWYARMKSQYKYTDTLYGSKGEAFLYKPWTGLGFNPIGHILDKYHYERCVEENTYIKTLRGYIKIKDTNINDIVYSYKNTTDIILEKWETEANESIEIKTSFFNIPSITTPEHKYYAFKSKDCYAKIACYPWRKWSRCNNCLNKNKNDIDWIRADNLNKNDFLLYPIHTLQDYNTPVFDFE